MLRTSTVSGAPSAGLPDWRFAMGKAVTGHIAKVAFRFQRAANVTGSIRDRVLTLRSCRFVAIRLVGHICLLQLSDTGYQPDVAYRRTAHNSVPGDRYGAGCVEMFMAQEATPPPITSSVEPDWASEAQECYRDVLHALQRARIPCAVGGAFAIHRHTGIWRTTKDLDLLLVPSAVPHALRQLQQEGFETYI